MIFAMVSLVLLGLICAGVEVGLHGLPFFFFRNAGAAAGNSGNLKEDQGPGQSDAPGAQHSSAPGTPKPTPTPSKTN
jgi:hypothetical protein